ncbi:signal peptidase I [Cellulosimicrobium cellulans]|uniref:signal peptidase I n=1 Tax=Cellulosimicrobium cellulans TaxID=1710 RepID=UPI00130EB015|nr:signal peptidase I [Cellulosimicrobium cellulans]
MVRLVARAVAVLLAAVLVVPLAWTWASGDMLLTVTSGSMSPTYEAGDVLVVQRPTGDELARVGRPVVVELAGGGTSYVHRVVEVTDGGAWLQGDANADRDPRPVTQDAVVGAPRAALTGWAGAALSWSLTLTGRVVLGVAVLGLLLVPARRPRRGAHAMRPARSEVG